MWSTPTAQQQPITYNNSYDAQEYDIHTDYDNMSRRSSISNGNANIYGYPDNHYNHNNHNHNHNRSLSSHHHNNHHHQKIHSRHISRNKLNRYSSTPHQHQHQHYMNQQSMA